MPTSVIAGITGQDGAYLAQQLLDDGQIVYGAFRRTNSVNFWRLEEPRTSQPQAGRGSICSTRARACVCSKGPSPTLSACRFSSRLPPHN